MCVHTILAYKKDWQGTLVYQIIPFIFIYISAIYMQLMKLSHHLTDTSLTIFLASFMKTGDAIMV